MCVCFKAPRNKLVRSPCVEDCHVKGVKILFVTRLLLLIGKPFEPPALPPRRGRPLSGLLEDIKGCFVT